MIAPIANVRPGVLGLRTLPINALAGNTVRVIAVGRGGVNKLGNHVGAKTGNRRTQRLPILKNISPITLVVE